MEHEHSVRVLKRTLFIIQPVYGYLKSYAIKMCIICDGMLHIHLKHRHVISKKQVDVIYVCAVLALYNLVTLQPTSDYSKL